MTESYDPCTFCGSTDQRRDQADPRVTYCNKCRAKLIDMRKRPKEPQP